MTMPTFSSKRRADGSPTKSTSADDTRDIKRPRLDDSGNQPQDLVRTLTPNRLAPFHPEFKRVEKAVVQLCDEVLNAMSQAGYQNEALTRSCEEIRLFRDPTKRYPDCKIFAFVGAAGAGKSSLINAIFAIGEIAIKSDDIRGTNVIHEYAHALMNQVTKFVVQVRYHSRPRIKEQVIQQCQYSFTLFERRKQMEEDADDIDPDELADLNDNHNTTIEYLHTTLHDPDDEDFDSETAVDEWLKKRWLDSIPLEEVVAHIMDKINAFLEERGVQDDHELHSAASTSELQGVYEQVSRPSTTNEIRRHPCRLIHTIRLHFRHSLIDDGTVFADTPGFGDANRFVTNIARDYLSIADHLFLVTPILRTDGATLDLQLQQIIQMRKMRESCLIVTKIDDKCKKSGKVDGELLSDDEAKVEEARSLLTQLDAEKRGLSGEKKKSRAAGNLQECALLQQKIDDLDDELEKAKATLEKARNTVFQNAVLSRNALMKPSLRDKYRKLARAQKQDLNVFFTSARSFDLHQQLSEDRCEDEKPQLDLAATGIPSLIQEIHAITSQGKFDVLEQTASSVLVGHLKTLISALTKTPWDRHKDLRNDIEVAHEKKSKAVLDTFSANLWAAFEDSVIQSFEDDSCFEKEAKKFLKSLSKMHAFKFYAFCKYHGKWKNSKGLPENWNERINLIHCDTVEKGISELKAFSEVIFNTFNLGVQKIFETLKQQLQQQTPDQTPGMVAFIAAIDRLRDTVSKQVRKRVVYFRSVIEDMRLKTAVDHDKNCFVAQELLPTYNGVVAITSKNADGTVQVRKRGEGIHVERVQLMREALTGPQNVFKGVLGHLSHVFEEEIHKCRNDLAAKLEASRKSILHNFDNQFQEAEPQGAASAVLMKQLLTAATKAVMVLEGPIADQLREIEMWEKGGA